MLGNKETNQWLLRLPLAEADTRLRAALEQIGAPPTGPVGHVVGKTKMVLMKNRNAAEITAELTEHPEGTVASVTVQMMRNKHQSVLQDLTEVIGEEVIDDRGLAAAIERMDRASRLFVRKEIRYLRTVLRPDEQVLALAQGTYEKKLSIVGLTTQRLFFYEKGILLEESLEEFPISVISSMTIKKGSKGESLNFTASGNTSTITGMMPSQGDAFAKAFSQLRTGAPTAQATAPTPAAPDVLGQLEQLGKLRDAGVLTEDEFEAKKQELLGRL
ncbi:SHOCT domain-containing protein [Kocuria sp. M1R5S2]|uniref:SHOCT domain-containing protein n=1 Tax=Kocuria rhizosphaerae TaxID=3376285 RepID=UPI0037B0013E